MTAAAPSSLASSVEKTNGAKLSRLLIDGGTTVLRKIFDRYHPAANLLADLNANYYTLNNLLRGRVLRRPQRDLLFPPGGATPDSNTFDITLLFLLLTNICGLAPPSSGWHTKPPPSDTSLEANLACIKFFRNELYGHVTTTGVDTSTFSALWLEISAVLVALGLHQAEIDRLKAEHCGEEDFIDVLFEWAVSEEDIKSQLKDIRQSQNKVQQAVEKVHQTQLEDRKIVQDEVLKKVAKIDTLKYVRDHAERYVEGTRLSIFAKVENWLDDRSSPNRVMVISGNAGMGKSVISAVLCEKMQEAGRLAGSHFCQHDRARHRNPKVMLQSLASQLCDSLPDYKKALVEKLSRNLGVEINNMEVKDLFEVLFEEPLTKLNDPGLTYLMVIDGLDESEVQGRNDLLDVIANYFQNHPPWIRFLVTTRPERNIAENLKSLHPLQLDPNVEENLEDIHLCFEKKLSHLLQSEHRESILQALVEKSEGVMLYAHYLVDFIKKEVPVVTPELLDSILPTGISSVYHSYFKRLETDLCKELKVTEDQFLNFLSAVAAVREPLPLGFVSKLLLPGKSTSVVRRKVNSAIACVSALLPVQNECIHFFHKSVKDWLIEKSYYGQHHFSVEEREGHRVLSELCIDELDEVKRKGVDCAQFTDTTKYALRHGAQHILQPEEDAKIFSFDEVVKKYVLDLELVYAKLCVSDTAASEDILCVQKHEGVKAMFEGCQRALGTLLHLLRKHIRTLTRLPHTIFQTLLNEGGPELSSKASDLLETGYSEMAYMEYLHKEDLQELVQSKFQCLAAVACFDVSPQLDYMVCECDDDTIQLWSLHTGKQLWKRDVKVTKNYYVGCDDDFRYCEPYRRGLSYDHKALFRSVVFHPTKDLVLPGILSRAYTFDGYIKPLFHSSKCRFSVCSISANKTKMLTDCPNNSKSIIMWSLTDGSEITHYAWKEDILSFAWSRDERLLAISLCCGSICLVDVLEGFKTLAVTATLKESEMIKFSPDCRSLCCLHFEDGSCDLHCFNVNMENDCNFSLDSSPASYHPWELESCSDTGYLLGDPFCFPNERDTLDPRRPGLAFVLNRQSVLRVSSCSNVIEMLYLDKLTKDSAGVSNTPVGEAVLSLNGDTLYVVTEIVGTQATLKAWDISSGVFKAEKRDVSDCYWPLRSNLVAVREGVLLETRRGTLELWNFELSKCIRSWTDLGYIKAVIPISEERVACEAESKVIILDTTREDIVSAITIHWDLVAYNGKCHVMTTDHTRCELQMQCGDVVLWKISQPFQVMPFLQCNTFSPAEQYCVVGGQPTDNYEIEVALYVLDAVSGRTLHMLCSADDWMLTNLDCKFVSDEECVTNFREESRGYCLRLFNVKTGDLLSEIVTESHVYRLAACPRKRLIAIGFNDSVNFKVLQVKLPGDKDSRKNKRSGVIEQLKTATVQRLQPGHLRVFN